MYNVQCTMYKNLCLSDHPFILNCYDTIFIFKIMPISSNAASSRAGQLRKKINTAFCRPLLYQSPRPLAIGLLGNFF